MIQSDSTQPKSEPDTGDRQIGGDESAQSLSLLGGVAGGEGLPQADEFGFEDAGQTGQMRGLSRGTVLVILIVLFALGALYGMRVMQGEVGTSGDAQIEARMEQILAKLSNPDALDENDPLRPQNMQSLFRDTDSIVASLDTDLSGRQVPAQFVKKNPFTLPIKDEPEPEEVVDHSAQQREAQLRQLESELGRLNLQSVMGSGSSPVAVIDGDIYRPGDAIGSFRIDAINAAAQTVTLEAADHTFTLTMGS